MFQAANEQTPFEFKFLDSCGARNYPKVLLELFKHYDISLYALQKPSLLPRSH